ncbi:hypothetical protein VMCG_06522 [Cytospora schulzeri]|uniref:C2H2-type domain-containing protein n=1 Tax=Cytospora schulzeri TaxID=448051 RepID=A0A423WBL7_9PEZI|nr:hypothetical protein VMCG_06522 [Valsa malicola]
MSIAVDQPTEEATAVTSHTHCSSPPDAFESLQSHGLARAHSDASFCSLDEGPGENVEDEVEHHPLYHHRDRIIDLLLERFHSCRTAHQYNEPGAGSHGSGRGSLQTVARAKKTTRTKRKAADSGDEEAEGDGNAFPRRRKKPKGDDEEAGSRLTLACPFSKKDPARHRRCYKYELKRVRDVKQHLRRCHRKAVYCPVCGQTFPDEETRDVHVRQRTCPASPDLNVEGVTETQIQQLAVKSSSKKSEEEQWFGIFEIVFPGHPRPKSPYVDQLFSDEIQSFRDFVTAEGPAILSEQLQEHQPLGEQDRHFLDRLLGIGCERIADLWAQRFQEESQHGPSVSPPEPTPCSPSKAGSARQVDLPLPSEAHQALKPSETTGTSSSFHKQDPAPYRPPLTPRQPGTPRAASEGLAASCHMSAYSPHSDTVKRLSQAFESPIAVAGDGFFEVDQNLFEVDQSIFNLDTFWQTSELWGVGALAESPTGGFS